MGVKFNPFTSKLDIVDSPSGEFSDIELALGTQSAPSLSFTGDPNTGIYSPGADQVAISTGGTGRLFVDANGKLGLGTSSPSKTLSVVGNASVVTSASTQNVLIGVSSGGIGYKNQIDFGHPAVGARIESERLGANTQSSLSFWTTSAAGIISRAVVIDQSQRVGIGTTSPSAPLSVQASSTAEGIKILGRAADDIGDFAFLENDGTTEIGRIQARTTELSFRARQSGQSIIFITGGIAERARIDSSGRLLVGTSSDSGGALLQVNDNRIRIATAKTPASATDTGTAGEICWDADYIYVCTATNTWKRTAIATW
jgi:hypothetical protein